MIRVRPQAVNQKSFLSYRLSFSLKSFTEFSASKYMARRIFLHSRALSSAGMNCRSFHSSSPTFALQIKIHIRGHSRGGGDAWVDEACTQYCDRLRSSGLQLTTIWHKNDSLLESAVKKESCPVTILDESGPQLDSKSFGKKMFNRLEIGGSRLCFVVGGAEGLPSGLRPGAVKLTGTEHFSLSRLTFTHQMARLLLVEQIYRATEIRRGSKYHKE